MKITFTMASGQTYEGYLRDNKIAYKGKTLPLSSITIDGVQRQIVRIVRSAYSPDISIMEFK